MLLGTYLPKLDDKGRLILPARFRDELSGGVVITRGQERCLYVFSEREFATFSDRIRQAPVTSKQGRDFIRLLLSGANQERPDAQHRVTLPPALRAYAGLERDLTVIGAGNRAEIWSTPAWEAYYASVESDYANTAEEVIPGLF
ncbi:MAG: cell division/cell wall cluster transcriptional repressor MraZ [Micrococcales bacterium 73-13]|nr:MAG: cell division/cell wall cluster transcriptional repressor MraZ [Micrococcales bacterium 73-13]